jgi:hypothetical protein
MILMNILSDVKTPPEFDFDANTQPKIHHIDHAWTFPISIMFFETPHAIGPQNSVAFTVHAYLNNLEFYLFMSNSYILLLINIELKF